MAEVELDFKDSIECPNCGSTLAEVDMKEIWYDGDDLDMECDECEYVGTVHVQVTVKIALWPDD